ncbi:MAG TPA: universal stress protein [Nocardioides sp.]|nr:universal stress protein [Nocardioides sp.]
MTIVVGHSPTRSDPSPIELAAAFARSVGTDLRVVVVVPARWPTPVAGATDREYAAWSSELGQRAVAEAQSLLAACGSDLPAEVVAVPGRSAAATLEDEAEASGAGMILVGSAEPGEKRRVVAGSTTDRLLHSSAIPVAIATVGYRSPAEGRIARATCAFRTDEESQSALARTAELCRETGAKLRVATFGVLGATMYPPEVLGERQVLEAYVEETAKAQEASVAALPDSGEGVETVVATGRDWPEALGRLDWDESDVLVVGSSTRGVLSRVFIGTMATRIVRHSPVPAVVVPR